MNVLIFTPSFAPRTGGVETVTAGLSAELSRRGHSVLVVTQRYPRSLPSRAEIDGADVRRLFFPNLAPTGLADIPGMLAGILIAAVSVARLTLLTWRFRPSLVNIHYVSPPARYMTLVARILRIPLVVSFHGSDVPGTPYGSTPARLVRRVCAHANAATACSHDLRDRLEDTLSPELWSATRVAYAGVSARAVDTCARTETHVDRTVAVVARLVEKKGIATLLDALAVLRVRGECVRVDIAGDGPLRSALERQSREAGVEQFVRFLGSLGRSDIDSLIDRADLVAVPSLWEAFGVVCLEAMRAGKAVVASCAGGIPEIVDSEVGILIPPGDPVALATAIQALCQNPSHAQELGRNGAERAKLWTWERMTDSYLDAYARASRAVIGDERPSQAGCA